MSQNKGYVQYEKDSQIAYLNQNTFDGDRTVIFPRHLYSGNARQQAYYTCFRPRDTELNYIIGVERDEHPDHFSHFGYARAPYGYGSGHWPGRYNTSIWCNNDPQPKDMAPSRFYEPINQGPFSIISQGELDYTFEKNYGMNLFRSNCS